MTDKTLRESLPVGSPRNKVEFLADAMEAAQIELMALIKDALNNQNGNSETIPTGNLLVNSDFTQSANWLAGQGDTWIGNMSRFTNTDPESCVLSEGTAMPMPFGWCAEVNIHTGQSSASCGGKVMTAGGEVADYNFNERANCAFLLNGYSCDAIMYQPFDMPCISSIGMEIPQKKAMVSVYYRGFAKGKTARFGILELDDDYHYVRIVAEKLVEEESNESRLIKQFIHGVELQAGKKYAYFIEVEKLNGLGNSVNETGVFINPEKTDRVPALNPNRSLVHQYGQLATFPKADLNTGKAVTSPILPMPCGIGRHLLLQNVDSSLRASLSPMSASMDGHTITLTTTGNVNEDTVNVRYYYSHIPMKLKFYS
ncbi:hypothetical protein [Photobacterium sp. DNB22_13_2]